MRHGGGFGVDGARLARLLLRLHRARRLVALLLAVVVAVRRATPRRRAATTAAADLRHVLSVQADLFASLTARRPRFVGGELVGLALLVGGASALAGDLALAVLIHRREAAVACSRC